MRAVCIKSAQVCQETRTAEVTVVDTKGNIVSLTLNADELSIVAELHAKLTPTKRALTKIPDRFQVGCGRFEPWVLLRFEDDVPYALPPEEARTLAEALISEADEASLLQARLPVN